DWNPNSSHSATVVRPNQQQDKRRAAEEEARQRAEGVKRAIADPYGAAVDPGIDTRNLSVRIRPEDLDPYSDKGEGILKKEEPEKVDITPDPYADTKSPTQKSLDRAGSALETLPLPDTAK